MSYMEEHQTPRKSYFHQQIDQTDFDLLINTFSQLSSSLIFRRPSCASEKRKGRTYTYEYRRGTVR